MLKASVVLFGMLLSMAALAQGGGNGPNPTPRPTPQQNICNTDCDEFEPTMPNQGCTSPDVSQARTCHTDCTNGNNYDTREHLCLPPAQYEPQMFSNEMGDEVELSETEVFQSSAPCSGQWWVDIETMAQYTEDGDGMGGMGDLTLSSTVSESCQK